MAATWYSGVCDDLYNKIAIWNAVYWAGEVHSTRQFLDGKLGKVVDKPTRCAHKIPFRQQELEHLLRIVTELRPDSTLVDEITKIKALWKHGQAVQGNRYNKSYWSNVNLPKGLHRIITLVFYPEHARDILNLLTEAKTGQQTATFDTAVADKQSEGKGIFEQ